MVRAFPWKRVLVAAILVAEVAVLSLVAWSASSGPMTGLAVAANTVSLTVRDQANVVHAIRVDRVVAPANGWLIAQADWGDGRPDAVLGSVWVPKGESRNLTIDLDPLSPLPRRLFVTLLADAGQPKVLEYSVAQRPGMQLMRGMGATVASASAGGDPTADRPVVAGDHLVQAHIALTPLSFAVGAGQASVSEATRTLDATSVVIPKVVAPAQAWLSVSNETTITHAIAEVLGEKLVPAGEQTGVVVPLSQAPGARRLIATLHVDLGTVGQFDFSAADIGNSYDQPYVAGGQTVSAPVRLVPNKTLPRR